MFSIAHEMCQHFGVCGGCQSQHIPYDEQLEMKERYINMLFGSCASIIGCDTPDAWRNKMEFTFSENKAGERFLGLLMKRGRGKVVTLQECVIAQPWMVTILHQVMDWWEHTKLHAYFPPKNVGSLRTLTLREGINTAEKMVILTVSSHPDFLLTEEQKQHFIQAIGPVDSIVLRVQHIAPKQPTYFTQEILHGKDHIFETLMHPSGQEYRFKIRSSSFFQPNTHQAEKLYAAALRFLESETLLLDLYCGTGTIGIFSAGQAERVIGIESVSDAIEDAMDNAKNNGITNATFLAGEVEKHLAGLPHPSCIMIDPPRAGLSPKAIQQVISLKSKKIIYISCNPASQKKNIESLEDYEIAHVQPIDQFPHTTHLENIVFLELKG